MTRLTHIDEQLTVLLFRGCSYIHCPIVRQNICDMISVIFFTGIRPSCSKRKSRSWTRCNIAIQFANTLSERLTFSERLKLFLRCQNFIWEVKYFLRGLYLRGQNFIWEVNTFYERPKLYLRGQIFNWSRAFWPCHSAIIFNRVTWD